MNLKRDGLWAMVGLVVVSLCGAVGMHWFFNVLLPMMVKSGIL